MRPARRVVTDLLIVAWLAFQVGVPLSWYLQGRSSDERFAWRMFSAEHMAECAVSLEEFYATPDGEVRESPPLDTLLHGSWVRGLTRWRPRQIEAVLQSRCDAGAVRVGLHRTCDGPGVSPSEWHRRSCRSAR